MAGLSSAMALFSAGSKLSSGEFGPKEVSAAAEAIGIKLPDILAEGIGSLTYGQKVSTGEDSPMQLWVDKIGSVYSNLTGVKAKFVTREDIERLASALEFDATPFLSEQFIESIREYADNEETLFSFMTGPSLMRLVAGRPVSTEEASTLCPHCDAVITARGITIGEMIRCPECHQPFITQELL